MAASSGNGAAFGFSAFFIVFVVLYLAVFTVSIVAWVKIISKAGYSGWWVLIAFVPIANVVMFLVFAFSDWPVRQMARGQLPPGQQMRTWTPSAPAG
jgi:uncharacterized membrane protein YhaH (DUF805 family)